MSIIRDTGFEVYLVMLTLLAMPAGGGQGDPVLSGGTNPPVAVAMELTIDDFVEQLLKTNAALRSAEASIKAAAERPVQDSALPNPMLTFSSMDPVDSYKYPSSMEKRYAIEQSFFFPGKRAARYAISKKGAEAESAMKSGAIRETLLSAKATFLDLYATRKAKALARSESSVLDRLARSTETKYRTGQVGQQDVLKVQTEQTMLRMRLLDLGAKEKELTLRMNELLARSPDTPVGELAAPKRPEISVSIEDLLNLGDTNSVELAAARLDAEKAGLAVGLARKNWLPDFKIGVEYQDLRDGEDTFMVMAGIELPFARGKNMSELREARMQAIAAAANAERMKRLVERQTLEIHARVKATIEQYDLYGRELIPQAEARLKASEAAYESGKADFMDVLESERFLLNARLMHVMSETEAARQLAELECVICIELKNIPAAGGATK
ncbi:MAG: hypothetical protein C0404_00160 [Verrucomicrobia bacterium]|nr:hypothetical protein [Verrucomicrobiota bacterium]